MSNIGNLVPVEILVQNTDLKKMMDSGLAEVVFRQVDSKFLKMVKCPIADSAAKAVQKAPFSPISPAFNINNTMNNALNLFVGDNGKVAGIVRKSARDLFRATSMGQAVDITAGAIETGVIRKDISKVGKEVKAISANIDKLLPMVESIQNVGYLNVAIGLSGIAVSAAGFAVMNSKLDNISRQLEEMKNILSKLDKKMDDILENLYGKQIHEFESMKTSFINLLSKIDNNEIDKQQIDNMSALLIDMTEFIRDIVRSVSKGNDESTIMLQYAFSLLPMHTVLLMEYMKAVKFLKGRDIEKVEYERYTTNLYNSVTSDEFIRKISDHYFLEGNNSYYQVCDIVNAHAFLVSNAQTQVDDMRELLSHVNNKEQYVLIETALEKAAKDHLVHEIPKIAEYTGESEEVCRSYFLGEEI